MTTDINRSTKTINCDENYGDFMEIELDGNELYFQISENEKSSILMLSSQTKVQELIDFLTEAKKELTR